VKDSFLICSQSYILVLKCSTTNSILGWDLPILLAVQYPEKKTSVREKKMFIAKIAMCIAVGYRLHRLD
jgi:hypothetical protein